MGGSMVVEEGVEEAVRSATLSTWPAPRGHM